ncbi:MAG: cache domain-containing protein [Holosporales bacterium]|jgi:hypothetical protein|nr:cache domain-containing protein [Holosporales bacterium]
MAKWIIASVALILGVGLYFYTLDDRPTFEQAEAMVKEAIDHFEKMGPEKVIAEVNTHQPGRWNKGALYLFAYQVEPRGYMIAHATNPELVKKNLYDLTDPDGKRFVKEYLDVAISTGHSEVPFRWPNPVTKKIENKIGVCRLTKDKKYVICSGVYSK